MSEPLQLPDDLLHAVCQYYVNRKQQSVKRWDKAADLARLDKLCDKYGFGMCNVIGIFCFTDEKAGVQAVISEYTFPEYFPDFDSWEKGRLAIMESRQTKRKD